MVVVLFFASSVCEGCVVSTLERVVFGFVTYLEVASVGAVWERGAGTRSR